jgi:hypothetical protein
MEMRMTFEGVMSSPVWCFASRKGVTYAGTGPYGEVLKSGDDRTWEHFKTVDDCHIRSMIVWANGLFMGTESLGRIYVVNFTTGNFYLFVETEDLAVTSFADYGGKLYAATSPRGIVYSFDGNKWDKTYNAYGGGISALQVYDGKLYAFLSRAETAVAFDGQTWTPIRIVDPLVQKPEKGELLQEQTVASYRNTTTPPFSFKDSSPIEVVRLEDVDEAIQDGTLVPEDRIAVMPTRPEYYLTSAAVDAASGMLAGGSRGEVYVYVGGSKNTFRQVYASCDGPTNAILNLADGKNFVAIGGTLYLVKGTLA